MKKIIFYLGIFVIMKENVDCVAYSSKTSLVIFCINFYQEINFHDSAIYSWRRSDVTTYCFA